MLAEQFDAFLLDLDGVVYLGERPLPGAAGSLPRLRALGKAVRFLSNDPRPSKSEVLRRLRDMRIEAVEEEVVSSGWVTAQYLWRKDLRSAYVVGSRELMREIAAAEVRVTNGDRADAVVVGCDEHVTYHHIRLASTLINRGAAFVATNPDGSFPAREGPLPATGAIVEAIGAATGKRPTVVGKPHPPMFAAALEGLDIDTGRVVVIGDNPETDVLGAHRAGMAAILISEEEISFPSCRDFRAPDAIIPDLTSLFDPDLTARKWVSPSFPWPGRVAVGVAAVVFDGKGWVLLGKRADNGLWGLPSGHVEPAETVEEAAIREVREETGLEVEVERLVGVYSDPHSQSFAYPNGEVVHFVTSCFRCKVTGGVARADGVEASEVAFFATDGLPDDLLPMHPRWLSDALSAKRAAFVR